MDVVRAGETYTFSFELSGDDLYGMTATMNVLQHPGDTPEITRALTLDDQQGKFVGTLTSAETETLRTNSVAGNNQWFIYATATDADENIQDSIKIYVTEKWV